MGLSFSEEPETGLVAVTLTNDDGEVVQTLTKGDFDESALVRAMVGREIDTLYPKGDARISDVVLRAQGITRPGVLLDCSFEVHAGEILGFAGVVGAGRTELARAVFGAQAASLKGVISGFKV